MRLAWPAGASKLRRGFRHAAAATVVSVGMAAPAHAAIRVEGTGFPTGGAAPNGVAFGDINGDGQRDVVLPNFNSSNLAFLPGNGTGALGAAATTATAVAPAASVLHDFDADGDL